MAPSLKSINTNWVYGIVMVYLALAFGWWMILLFRNNQTERHLKKENLELLKQLSTNTKNIEGALSQEIIEANYKTNIYQIYGEGIVFILALGFGLFLISRADRRELDYRSQQKNFLLSITHELKSPLASTKLVLETIKKRNLSKEQTNELIGSALAETDRLGTLVNDMLLAARMEEVYDPVYERINVKNLFNNVMTSIKLKYPQIKWEISEELLEEYIIVDKSGLTSIIINLIENAAKYSNKDSLVRVIYKVFKNKLIIKVADQGIGIPDDEKNKIFDRFYRVGDEKVRKSKGTGIGLYLVKNLVGIYNGSIKVHDNRPKGTIFDVVLPINLPENSN